MHGGVRGRECVYFSLPNGAEVVRAGAGPAEPPVDETTQSVGGDSCQLKFISEEASDAIPFVGRRLLDGKNRPRRSRQRMEEQPGAVALRP